MANPTKILLVEGESDKLLFTVICSLIGLDLMIKVAVPREIDKASNSKGGVFTVLPTLLKQLPDGEVQRLGIVVDADHPENDGMGYRRTLNLFEQIVGTAGYRRIHPKGLRAGILFGHGDGLHDLGIWIMPNNRENGILEDWLKLCLHHSEADLYRNACRAVETLAKPHRFSAFDRIKAEIATWLAWQETPGQGAHAACSAGLIDQNNVLFRGLTEWLSRVFS